MPLVKPTPPAAVPAVPTPVPQRSDMANFAVRGDAMMGWFPGGITSINAVVTYTGLVMDYIDLQTTAAQQGATDAGTAAGVAATQAGLSATSAATAATYAGAAQWASGTYAIGVVVWSPANRQLYRRKGSPGATATDPSADATNWDPLGQLMAVAVAALNVDCSLGNYFTKTIAGASTFTFSNAPASPVRFGFILRVTHTSGAITWPAAVVWADGTAPTLTTGKVHLFMFLTENAGTTWRAAALINYAS